MQIRKVKYNGSVARIEYARPVADGEYDEFTLVSHDEPRQSFKTALDSLAPHVGKLLDVPDSWTKNLKIRGVSFSWHEEVMGAVVTALKTVPRAKAPLVVNTPHQAERTAADRDISRCLEENFLSALGDVAREAEGYVIGQRAQGALFEGEGNPEGEAPPAEEQDPKDGKGQKPARRGGSADRRI